MRTTKIILVLVAMLFFGAAVAMKDKADQMIACGAILASAAYILSEIGG